MSQLRAEDLSERQRQILDGLVDGKSNGVLAEQLGITIDGVKWHVSQMLWDTGCTDRYQLADWWERERGPQRRGAFVGFLRPSRGAFAGAMRLAGTLAMTAVLVVAIYAGWTCSGATAPATVTPASVLGKIAYVHDGDLYVKQLPDGAPQQITHTTQADRDGDTGFSDPVWSPSGEWLIVRKRAQAGVIRADGTHLRLFDTTTSPWSPPVWSPTDDRLAYIALGEGGTPDQLVIENANGSGRTVVAHAQPGAGEDGYLHDPEWSNDGVRIAYVEEHRAPNAPAAGPTAADLRYEAVRVVSSSGGSEPEEMFVEPSPLTQGLGLIAWNTLGLLFYRTPSFTADTAGGVTLQFLHIETGHTVDLCCSILRSSRSRPGSQTSPSPTARAARRGRRSASASSCSARGTSSMSRIRRSRPSTRRYRGIASRSRTAPCPTRQVLPAAILRSRRSRSAKSGRSTSARRSAPTRRR